jgi:hypothetical protein
MPLKKWLFFDVYRPFNGLATNKTKWLWVICSTFGVLISCNYNGNNNLVRTKCSMERSHDTIDKVHPWLTAFNSSAGRERGLCSILQSFIWSLQSDLLTQVLLFPGKLLQLIPGAADSSCSIPPNRRQQCWFVKERTNFLFRCNHRGVKVVGSNFSRRE